MSGELKSPVEDALEHQPFGALQLRVVLLCAFVQAFDGFDLGTIGMAAPSLIKAWGVAPPALHHRLRDVERRHPGRRAARPARSATASGASRC